MNPRAPPGTPARRAAALGLALLLLAPLALLAPPGGATHQAVPAACYQGNDVDVMLVLDRSGSMTATDGNPTTRLQDAKAAATGFLSLLGASDRSGLASFSTFWTLDKTLDANHAGTQAAVNAQAAGGATSLYAGIRLGLFELLNQFHAPHPPGGRVGVPGVQQVLIVLTDGAQTTIDGFEQNPPGNPSPVNEAAFGKSRGVVVFVIALGNDPNLLRWYPTLQATATSAAGHFFAASSGANLPAIFASISQRIRDAQDPTAAITAPPDGRLYVSGADVAPSPFGSEMAVRHRVDLRAAASDDCLVDRVVWSVDTYDGVGRPTGTVTLPLTNNHTAPYTTRLDCDALPGGRHLLRMTAHDFVDKRAVQTRWFWCLNPTLAAEGHALYAWTTNPLDLRVDNVGARLPGPLGGNDLSITARQHDESTVYLDASLFHDEVTGVTLPDGNGTPSRGLAKALSRVLNLTFSTLDPAQPLGPLLVNARQRIEVLEAEVNVTSNGDAPGPAWFTHALTGRSNVVCAEGFPLTLCNPGAVSACYNFVFADPAPPTQAKACTQPSGATELTINDLHIFVDEHIRRSGPGWADLTINALRIVRDTPEQRSEVILGQAYGGVSFVGREVLRGPHRGVEQANDAGLGRDASADPAAPEVLLGPTVVQGRLRDGRDVDSYALPATPGEKLQVTFVPSNGAHVKVLPVPVPGAPNAQVIRPSFNATLYDDDLDIHDLSSAAVPGAPVELELNVDEPGVWRWTVSGPGEYTMVVSRVTAPMTADDDAALQQDAGEGCGDALLVGPGVHLGTLELGDQADAYRFNAQEGQQVAVVLRPGDTLEAADMDLSLFDPACNLIDFSGGAKGSPEIAQFTVPVGGTGLYRAVVHHAHGIGLYQLVIAPIPVTA